MIVIGVNAEVNIVSFAKQAPLKRAYLAKFPTYKDEYKFIKTMLIHAGAIE